MPAPQPITPWHDFIIKQFSGRNYYAFLGYLRNETGKSWSMDTKQEGNPKRVLFLFRDKSREMEPLFLRISATGPKSTLVESGQKGWVAGPDFKVRYKNLVPLDRVGTHPSFDWIREEGLNVAKKIRMAKKIASSYMTRGILA